MNLNAYDAVEANIYNNNWINPIYKKLYSRSIEYHPYYAFLKKYNKESKTNDYYIAMLDDTNNHANCRSVVINNKLIKIDLSPIWTTSSLCKLKERTCINIEEVDRNKDGVIYYLDV